MTFIVLVGMIIKGNRTDFINTYINKYSFDLSQIIKVFAITPFAFIGFDAIPQLSKELNFSKKKASRVAVISLVMGALIYNILNIITALAYSPEQAISLEWAAGKCCIEYFRQRGLLFTYNSFNCRCMEWNKWIYDL